MTAVRRKTSVDAETRKLEREFMAAMGKIRDQLAREVEDTLLAVLERNLNGPVSTKTPPRYKITECDGEMIFMLIAFEAKLDA